MDDLLAQLQDTGRLDSQGSFSLDAGRRDLLMEKFQLPAAIYFMLHAVGAAVCSGASHVHVKVRSDHFGLRYDGQPFTPDQVESCFGSLWSPERDRETMRLRELAIARIGSHAWGAREFQTDRSGSFQRLRIPKPGWPARLAWIFGDPGRRESEALLHQHLVSTPSCQISVNGRPVDPLQLPTDVVHAVAIEWSALASHLPETFRTLDSLEWLSAGQRSLMAGGYGLVARLPQSNYSTQIGMKSCWPGYLDLVLHGRLYRTLLPASLSGCWAMFVLSGVKRDLSHSFIAPSDLQFLIRLIVTELNAC
jgi:hypothetical protein